MESAVGKAVAALLVTFLLLYAGDWLVLRARAAHGSAYSSVQVQEYLATPLKGNKAEYDYMGTISQTCDRSLFPHGGQPPCWWLRRHRQQWEN